MNREELGNIMTVRTKPAALVVARSNGHREDGGNWQSKMEPHVGLEFDSADEAQEFYSSYATQVGFKIRIGQLYRSRVDGSVISRRFVCSKEGFQTSSRTGCQAFIRVQKVDSGKWVLANIKKEHNHEFEASAELCPRIQRKSIPTPRSSAGGASRTGIRSHEDDDPSSVADMKRLKREDLDVMVGPIGEPYKGLEFNSANEAYKFYHTFAANAGFRIRIGQLFRSKHDGSITSRRFVCSKEGHQHPSRVGCGAYMRIQRQESGRWMVDRLQKEHNHEFETPTDPSRTVTVASKGEYRDEGSSMLENLDLVETNGGLSLVRRVLDSNISKDWYSLILEYFQSRQAEDTGFFYGVELREGKGTNIFWADSRSRFSCTQFGDAVIFDTSYRRGSYLVPFASFVGVNHHRQPVLLGCALVADESEQSFTWIFQTFLTAMSGHHPVSIIADLDQAIQHSIARVFPGTLHRFSAWQVLAKEQENLGALFSMDAKFKSEYEACIRSQAASEFDSAWNKLMDRYNLRENPWFKEMYRTRKSWVPLHLKGTFFAGIPMDGSLKSYFGTLLTPRTTLNEFIVGYEKAVEQRREEERKEDFNSFNIQAVLHTKDPIEEQCRSLYTMTMFKVFQKEFLESFSYAGMKINVEGAISRYLVQRCPNGDERTETNTVAFNTSNLNISCNCKMFEFEGVLCRHALRVFNLMNVRELPSRYILHRWGKSAKYGILRDAESGGGGQDFKALMVWSLREEARNYIEAGASSLERYKLAFEIMQEGRRNLCWQN